MLPSFTPNEQGAGALAPAPRARLSLLDSALHYTSLGWHVFPVAGIGDGRCSCGRGCGNPGKHPLTPHGLHDATTDRLQLARWWHRWPDANVAIACGPSGLAVIDVDPAHDGWASLGRLHDAGYQWARTATVRTGGGGVHLYFVRNLDVHNSASSLPGVPFPIAGIDLRGIGGYVVAPPSRHRSGRSYVWLGSDTAALGPLWLRPPPPPPHLRPRPLLEPTGCTRYGLAALRDEVDRVRRASVGCRNNELNRAAFSLGQLVATEHLEEALVWGTLREAALAVGLSEVETERTLTSGLNAGIRAPRQAWA